MSILNHLFLTDCVEILYTYTYLVTMQYSNDLKNLMMTTKKVENISNEKKPCNNGEVKMNRKTLYFNNNKFLTYLQPSQIKFCKMFLYTLIASVKLFQTN